MNLFSEFFSYTFIIYALIAGSLIAVCSALLGVPLVLKRYSMIGDGLSHVAFGSMAIAMALNASPLMISIPITVLSAFLLLRVSSNSNIKGDSSVALISTSSMALGILITSMTSGLNTDVTSFLFGSILSIGKTDVIISIVLAIFVVGFFVIFYNSIFSVTFDENFSNATGIKSSVFNSLIAVLTALTVVIGMRLMGAMMISSLIIFPSLSAMRIFKSYKSVTLCAWILISRNNANTTNNISQNIIHINSGEPCIKRTIATIEKMWEYDPKSVPQKYWDIALEYLNEPILATTYGICQDVAFACHTGQTRRECDPCAVPSARAFAQQQQITDMIQQNCTDK